MKLRSSLLVACMVLVPALAMFSHLIPGELRTGIRGHVATLVSVCLGKPAEAGTPTTESTAFPARPLAQKPDAALQASAPGGPAGSAPAAGASSALAPPPPASASPPTTPTATAAGDVRVRPGENPQTVGTISADAEDAVTPALVAQLADRTRQARDQQARDLQAIGTQLAALGAVAFTCQPLPGPDGLFTCDCRVPVDSTGQLQRVFQASGRDPTSASVALVEQVTAFHQRSNQRPRDAAGLPPAPTVTASPPTRAPVPNAAGRNVPNDGTR